MSEDSWSRRVRRYSTLAPQSAFERARDIGRVRHRHATMASEERLRDSCGSPRWAPDCAQPGGSEGADSIPVEPAISPLTAVAKRRRCVHVGEAMGDGARSTDIK